MHEFCLDQVPRVTSIPVKAKFVSGHIFSCLRRLCNQRFLVFIISDSVNVARECRSSSILLFTELNSSKREVQCRDILAAQDSPDSPRFCYAVGYCKMQLENRYRSSGDFTFWTSSILLFTQGNILSAYFHGNVMFENREYLSVNLLFRGDEARLFYNSSFSYPFSVFRIRSFVFRFRINFTK
jgi:hypothetical protein